MFAAIPKDQKISFWGSIKHGFPLMCLLMGDFITIEKPSKEGVGLLIDTETYRLVVFSFVYLLSAWVIYLRRKDFSKLMRGHWIFIAFVLYAMASFLWSANPVKAISSSAHLLGHYLIAVAALLMFRGHEVTVLRVYSMFSFLFVPACLATALLFPYRNIHIETGRWMALTWNPNTLGYISLIMVWANVSYFFYATSNWMRLMLILATVGALVLILGSGSVTAASLAVFVIFGVPTFIWFASSRSASEAVIRIASVSLLVFGVAGYFYATSPELFEVNRALGSVGRDSSLTGRAGLWEIAWKAIHDKPWFGWSFDFLQSLPTKYQIRYNQFHNGYLDIMVRGGVVALGFIIIFAVTTAVRIIKIAPMNKRFAASFGVLLIVLMLHNYSEASFGTAPNPLWLLFTFIYIGVSPNIVRWYETGIIEVKKPRRSREELEELKEASLPAQVVTRQPQAARTRMGLDAKRQSVIR